MFLDWTGICKVLWYWSFGAIGNLSSWGCKLPWGCSIWSIGIIKRSNCLRRIEGKRNKEWSLGYGCLAGLLCTSSCYKARTIREPIQPYKQSFSWEPSILHFCGIFKHLINMILGKCIILGPIHTCVLNILTMITLHQFLLEPWRPNKYGLGRCIISWFVHKCVHNIDNLHQFIDKFLVLEIEYF